MKSIKPGRGPSAMNAIGSLIAAVFGVIWISFTSSMGAPTFFVLFGFVFIALAVIQAIYHFINATSKNRMSLFDITEHTEEDPLQQHFTTQSSNFERTITSRFCPHCGNKVLSAEHNYCANCGKRLQA